MIWLTPVALVGLVAIAAPILIHILVQRRAQPFAFPSLRFLQPARLAAIRRHVLDDALLLAVRVAIIAVAAVALAGPLLVTSFRRQLWDRRVIRAVVTDRPAATGADTSFSGPTLRDSLHRAIAWLDTAPPGRREVVVAAPLVVGSFDAADMAAIPPTIGVRFERSASLPQMRTVAGGRLVTGDTVLAREVLFAGPQTSVRETATKDAAVWPIDLVHEPEAQAAVNAAEAAVLRERIWIPEPNRHIRLITGTGGHVAAATTGAAALSLPWMADAAAHIARDRDLQNAASRVSASITDAHFSTTPSHPVATAADGRALAVAAAAQTGEQQTMIILSAAPPADLVTPLLMRSIADAVASIPDLQASEVLPIPDVQLQQWTRPAAPPGLPTADELRRTGADDDRRWFWIVALCLITVETFMRRARPIGSDIAGNERAEASRVA